MADEPMGELWKYHPEYHRVADFLGLDVHDRLDYGIAQKISFIRDWAGLTAKKDTTEYALSAIQQLKQDLGIPYRGKDLISELYQHIRLDQDRMREEGRQKEPERETPKENKKVEKKKEPKEEEKVDVKKEVEAALSSYFQKTVHDLSTKQTEEQRSTP